MKLMVINCNVIFLLFEIQPKQFSFSWKNYHSQFWFSTSLLNFRPSRTRRQVVCTRIPELDGSRPSRRITNVRPLNSAATVSDVISGVRQGRKQKERLRMPPRIPRILTPCRYPRRRKSHRQVSRTRCVLGARPPAHSRVALFLLSLFAGEERSYIQTSHQQSAACKSVSLRRDLLFGVRRRYTLWSAVCHNFGLIVVCERLERANAFCRVRKRFLKKLEVCAGIMSSLALETRSLIRVWFKFSNSNFPSF